MRGGRGGDGEAGHRDIEDEVRFHIEGRVEELIAVGHAPDEARRMALAAFGDVERVRAELQSIKVESERRHRRREWLRGWGRDMRTGLRRLRRSPGYSVVALLTMTLGIGAAVAMFTVVNAVVLRPLPYPSSDRLVRLWPASNFNIALSRYVGSAVSSVSSSAGISHWGLTLTGEGQATVLQAAAVDAGYFDVFGVQPVLGRPFLPEETEPSRSGVVLLGYDLWQSRFGGDPGVVGRELRLSGLTHDVREIIGVMPARHQTQGQRADVWVPLDMSVGRTIATDSSWYVNEVVARLAPGATVAAANAEIRSVASRLHADNPGLIDKEVAEAASAVRLIDALVGDVRSTLLLLLGAVGLVLLITCGNLANLVLARSVAQRRELALQAAIGASRWLLVRHQLAESALVAIGGGLMGALGARLLLSAVNLAQASGLPRSTELTTDWRVFAFAAATSLGALLLFGLLPALRSTAGDLRGELHATGRTGSRGPRGHQLSRALVAGEIAMATVLSIAAALVIASFMSLRSTDPGIDTSDVLAITLNPPADRYTGPLNTAYYERVTAELAALPGVTAVGAIHLLPFTDNNWSFPYLAEGQVASPNEPLPSANFRLITPGYLDAVDQPLLRGRDFNTADRPGSTRTILINRTFADQLWPGQDPIGKTINIFGNIPYEVVGLVGDVRQHSLDREPRPEMYVAMAQWNRGGTTAIMMLEGPRATDSAADARRIIAAIDPDVPVTEAAPLDQALGDSLAQRRFVTLVLAAFGALAVALGAIGVYGVMSHLVGARIPDFGIRLALGASPADVRMDALRAGLVPIAVGLVAGTLAATATAGFLRSQIQTVAPLSATIYLAVSTSLLAVALLACWLPARRAARTDPLAVLRSD